MIGGFAIGARPQAAFRRILFAGVTFSVALAGGGAVLTPVVRTVSATIAVDGGGTVVLAVVRGVVSAPQIDGGGAVGLGIVRGMALSAAVAGGGSVALAALRGLVLSAAVNGGGAVLGSITVDIGGIDLAAVRLPGGSIITGPGPVDSFKGPGVASFTIGPVGGFR